MKNAVKFDGRITVGLVPDADDLDQLKGLGYKTLVDVREESEKFGGLVEKRAVSLGMHYLNIPVSRDEIKLADLQEFYRAMFEKGSAPLYVFSRFGRKPLAFLLLFDAVASGDSVNRIYQRAARFGFSLESDLCLQSFIVGLINEGSVEPIVRSIRELRPDLLGREIHVTSVVAFEPRAKTAPDPVTEELDSAVSEWHQRRNPADLRRRLRSILDSLEKP